MKYYLVVGEPSGDMYGAMLMKHIAKFDPNAEFRFWGGHLMEQVGGTQINSIDNRAFMGIWEVLANLSQLKKNFTLFKNDLADYMPDALILIDYPGFNLRVAPYAHELGIPIHYYIAPKVWAWNAKRVKKIQKYVSYLYTIFPFETSFFSKHHISVDYVGNPIVDKIQEFKPHSQTLQNLKEGKPIIALLPGSRKMELKHVLPIMCSVISHFPNYRFVVAGAPNFNAKSFDVLFMNHKVEVLYGKTYEILSVAKLALVTSGTATLETALWNVPQVVCYKFSAISYYLVKALIKVPYISLVNLILNKPLVPELIQNKLTTEGLINQMNRLIEGKSREEIKKGYAALRVVVGGGGATQKVAELIYNRTSKPNSVNEHSTNKPVT